MKRNLSMVLGCLSLAVFAGKEATAQITQLKNYKNYTSAAIGTYQGINFREAGFSGIYPIPNTDGKEFWICSDRGVNIDAANANPSGCRPTYDKIYAFPSYAPKIHRVRVKGDSIQILRTITMKRPTGTGATGIINPTGLGSTVDEIASTDTVKDCANFNAKTVAKDIWGVDAEGIVVDKEGFFWVCEEGGPTIWKMNRNGVVVKRYTPYANLAGVQPQDVQIDTVFKYRKNNRGFEGIAIAPNGKIYAIIQSPILYPTKSVGENTRIHRILEIDPATNATRMFAYVNDGIIGSGSNQIRLRDWKIGDMAAINDTTFLVLEAAARGTSDVKRVYKISINGATNVTSGLYGGVTLEALADEAGLTANNITPVKKTLVMDLLANGWPATLDKAEGIAIINDSTIAIGNDNDYGQFSPNEDGIATATANLSNIYVYRLQGNDKLKDYVAPTSLITQGITGTNSSQDPYLIPSDANGRFTSIITAGDVVNGYKMVGLPDGMGAFDNGNGTFTIVLNHEVGNGGGVTRAHGAKGSFVSKWIVNKSDFSVVSGEDLIKKVNLWNKTTQSYTTYNAAFPMPGDFGRFCSADLAAVSAYYNSKTGKGTMSRIFLNGEETGSEGRGMAHVASGPDAGTSWELPALGKFSWENSVASPTESDTTVVVGLDDATPGQIYVYVGTKTNAGSEVERAGLTNGRLFGISVNGLLTETSASVPAPNTPFTLVDLGDVRNKTGSTINTESNNAGVTQFLRPEDGAWDPSSPNDFYFVTTNSFSSPSRLWKVSFTDATKPMMGGTITAVLDGTEGQKMMDNMGIDNFGHIMIQEDVGGNSHNGKIWMYDIATDALSLAAFHDTTRFIAGGSNYLTQDEEASGIIDVQEILGPGMFLTTDQAHYGISGEVVEGGQLLAFYNPATAATSPEINIAGNNQNIEDGAMTPTTANNTDFGNVNTGNTTSKTFTIENKGNGMLTVSGIQITGAQASEFTLTGNPSFPMSIAANTSKDITVKFAPVAAGEHTAMIDVMSNDVDEKNYDFAIIGNGVSTPEINVKGNNVNILNGDMTPGVANNTDFGVVKMNNTATKKYTIENTGEGNLTVSGISFGGANAGEFTLVSAPTFPLNIATAGNLEFTVQFAPLAIGTRTASVKIESNDNDEATYEFGLQGMVPDPQSVSSITSSSPISLYPNPTGNEATIQMMLAKDVQVAVTVYDLKGQEIMQVAKDMKAGAQQITLNTADLKNGVYFVQVNAGSQSTKLKMVVVH